MRLLDVLGTASRNLRRQKLRSALTIFAVVIGATSVTIMLALVTGAKGFFLAEVESTGQLQQIVVSQATDLDYDHARWANSSDGSGIKLSDELVAKIAKLPHVAAVSRIASPYVFEAMIYNGKKLTVNNAQASDANGVVVRQMAAGRDFTPADGKGTILISQPYADKLGFAKRYDQLVGQTVTLVTRNGYTGDGATVVAPQFGPGPGSGPGTGPGGGNGDGGNGKGNDPNQSPPTELKATVVGVVLGEDTTLYFPLSWAHGLLDNRRYDMTDADRKAMEDAQRNRKPGSPEVQPHLTLITQNDLDQRGYNSLVVKADKTSSVEEVAAAIRTLGVGAATARSFIDAQLQIFTILSLVLGGIGGIALAVAAIGVVNTMVMAILERTREIGVMRACGATRATIRRLFTVEAGLLGFTGGVLGIAAGYGLTRVANIFINDQLASASIKAKDIIGLEPWLILAVVGSTTVVGALAGLYPAFRAARLNPVEALRYE
jgi:ABC-type antimicrobial peptide transport system permease subunit